MREQEVRNVPAAPHGSRLLSKKWIFLSFLGILSLLLFFAFFGLDSITGNVIKGGNSTIEDSFKIQADIGNIKYPVELKQKISEILIETDGTGNKIYLGKNSIIDLSEIGVANILIKDFDGYFLFDGKKILELKGTISKFVVNNFPTSSIDGEISLRMDEALPYRSLELKDVYIKKYESSESGKVRFGGGKVSMELNNESFLIENFFGNLKSGIVTNLGIQRTGLNLDGTVKNAKIGSDFQINLFK